MTASQDAGGELAAPLDLLLTAAANGPLRRFAPTSSWTRLAGKLVAQPGTVTRRGVDLAGELAWIVLGRSERAPSKRDRRFTDPAWSQNPLLRRVVQAYLAAGATVETLLADARLDWQDDERMRFVVQNIVEALAPSNNPLLSPLAWKAVIDTGGLSTAAGLTSLVKDLATPPRVPSMVEPDAFEVGKTVAATPGAVVLRTPVFELIQYAPQTPQVRTAPLLIVPPVINKYYIVDLSPDRSMVDYFVKQGQQVFVVSWRNPDARHRSWNMDTYGAAIIEAMDAAQRITGSVQCQLMATCSGGILAAMTLSHLAGMGQLDRVAGLTLAVTVLDYSRAGLTAAIADEHAATLALAASGRKGYLDGSTLAEVFAWLRPTDLIWTYWVNNYLQGRKPPPFDILFWNADTTRMTAALHRDLLGLGLSNALSVPGGATMLGNDVDLGKVTVDSYVVAGIADHICQWQACYRSAQLLGGPCRFILSTSGHIASMVNPPGSSKATFQVNGANPSDPEVWLRSATSTPGSWWPDYVDWLGQRSGSMKSAPDELGGAGLDPMEPAPGTYVFDR
jgi:polyhydroxyalkanoate synthase